MTSNRQFSLLPESRDQARRALNYLQTSTGIAADVVDGPPSPCPSVVRPARGRRQPATRRCRSSIGPRRTPSRARRGLGRSARPPIPPAASPRRCLRCTPGRSTARASEADRRSRLPTAPARSSPPGARLTEQTTCTCSSAISRAAQRRAIGFLLQPVAQGYASVILPRLRTTRAAPSDSRTRSRHLASIHL